MANAAEDQTLTSISTSTAGEKNNLISCCPTRIEIEAGLCLDKLLVLVLCINLLVAAYEGVDY